MDDAVIVAELFFGIVAGAVGVAFIVHGRLQNKFVPFLSGVLLCASPYVIESWLWRSLVGAVLLAAPFVIDF